MEWAYFYLNGKSGDTLSPYKVEVAKKIFCPNKSGRLGHNCVYICTAEKISFSKYYFGQCSFYSSNIRHDPNSLSIWTLKNVRNFQIATLTFYIEQYQGCLNSQTGYYILEMPVLKNKNILPQPGLEPSTSWYLNSCLSHLSHGRLLI